MDSHSTLGMRSKIMKYIHMDILTYMYAYF
jgi:hypothetical protein